ncbi:hypothetical protein GCM10027021_24290 [Dyella kyungheensis]
MGTTGNFTPGRPKTNEHAAHAGALEHEAMQDIFDKHGFHGMDLSRTIPLDGGACIGAQRPREQAIGEGAGASYTAANSV